MGFISEDRKTINLPVPLGTVVYQYHTDCNDACMFQKEAFDKVFPPIEGGRCSSYMPCHTQPHSVKPVELSLSNLDWVLDAWCMAVFESEAEAHNAMGEIVDLHKKQLVELGLRV